MSAMQCVGLEGLQPYKRQRIVHSHVAKYPAGWEEWLDALTIDDCSAARYILG